MGLTAINRNIEVIAIDGLTKAPIGLVKQFLEKAGVKKADLKTSKLNWTLCAQHLPHTRGPAD